MKNIAEDLKQTVWQAADKLLAVSEEEAAKHPAPGKWSPKEIIGHLIDSASNNHGRFVKAQYQGHMVFEGYEQDNWVRLQAYQDAEWPALVRLWRDYNLHLSYVISHIPDEVARREVQQHSLHKIAWQTVPEHQPTTLAYFIEDYIGHLKHHLTQALH